MTIAVSWQGSDQPQVVTIAPGQRVMVGRSSDVNVVIDDPKVSREHAAITAGAVPGASHLEHLSATNPTLVNDMPVSGQVALMDGALIKLGDATLTFHDLHARDRVSGPVCHVCGRENTDADRDCWYCGTSLLNAPTTLRERRPVVVRVVSASGAWADLYSGLWIALKPDGSMETLRVAPSGDVIALHVVDGRPVLADPRTGASAESTAQDLGSGAVIAVDPARFVLIASEESAA